MISEISEDEYFAGWHMGIEFIVWAALADKQSILLDHGTRISLGALSAECGGWVYWSEEQVEHTRNDGSKCLLDSGATLIPQDEWLAKYEARRRGAAGSGSWT